MYRQIWSSSLSSNRFVKFLVKSHRQSLSLNLVVTVYCQDVCVELYDSRGEPSRDVKRGGTGRRRKMARSRRKRKRWEEGIILLATHAHDVLSPPPLVVQSLLLWMMDRTQFLQCKCYTMTHTLSNKSTMETITIHKIMLGETNKAATVLDPSPNQPPKRAPKKSPNENL